MTAVHRRRRRVLAVSLAFLAPAFWAPASAMGEPLFGIGDQSASTFYQPLFRKLDLRFARLVVPWDVALHGRHPWIRQWLTGARVNGVEPLVAFGRRSGTSLRPVSVRAFRRAFLRFHQRFPEVSVYSPWNEANHRSQPTAKDPVRVARYYQVVRAGCPRCQVVAADVLDQRGVAQWLRRFLAALRGVQPQIWGLHNYLDVNHHRPVLRSGTAAVLRTVPGEVWLTETGGLVQWRSWRFSERRAAAAVQYLFKLAAISPRITRVYLYNWWGTITRRRTRRQRKLWDSGLVGPRGRPRPAYFVVRSELSRYHHPSGAGSSGPSPPQQSSPQPRQPSSPPPPPPRPGTGCAGIALLPPC